MDCPSDFFQPPLSQVCHFDLFRSPLESTSSDQTISPLLHPNSASQRWGGYRQEQNFFSSLPGHEERQVADAEAMRSKTAVEGNLILPYRLGDRRKCLALESHNWSHDCVKAKQLKGNSMAIKEGEVQNKGHKEKVSVSREDTDRKRVSREGRQQQKHELKLQLEEARGKLLELQRKVWRVYGEHVEEDKSGEEENDRVIDKRTETFSEGEPDDHLFGELYPPGNRNGNSEPLSGDPVDLDLDVDLDGEGVWLGCSLVQGEWENFGSSEKFAQTLKQELASAVSRVIDRVLDLYTESDNTSSSASILTQKIPTSRMLDPNPGKKSSPSVAASKTDQDEALPLVTKRPQERRNSITKSRHNNSLIPQTSPSLPFVPQPTHPSLLAPRTKDPFLSSCPPNPTPLPLPLLHYTMQHLFTRSLSSMPLHKDGLSNESFIDFRSNNPSFPPLPLLGQLNPPLGDRARDEVMRVMGVDGGDAALYLGPGTGLSPCHLKKAKLMFFYTRYPSSNTLKTYFPDVKFNRCVTSQLIKWFSNFREFFYIQMERFARQATREGSTTAKERTLRLSRNSELFRILNMHYNKSNDFQVPDRFVEVSEVALREFFAAIQSGRDTDPCWKKSIYKIICKLDSPLPESFRLPGCPMDAPRMA